MNSLRAIIAFVLLTVTFREGYALTCWRCSSDAKNGEFCHDPFSPEKIPENRMKYNYVECKEPTESDKVAVCKKLVSNIRNKVVVKRTCAIESKRDMGEECAPVDTPSYVKTVFCETCRSDGCNAHIATDYFALEDEFPLDELRKVQVPVPFKVDNTPNVDVENGDEDLGDEDEDDNDIGRDADRRGSLVTHQDHRTEAVHHAVDPELTQGGNNSADQTKILSTLSLVSSTLLAIYFSH